MFDLYNDIANELERLRRLKGVPVNYLEDDIEIKYRNFLLTEAEYHHLKGRIYTLLSKAYRSNKG